MKRFLLPIIFCFSSSWTWAQRDVLEEVQVHFSHTELIAGETLYFSAFVTSKHTGKLTALSTVLYIEILDEDNEVVHQAKIPMSGGRGHGAFFVSPARITGTYHFVAYTRWMRNFNDYFHREILLINPYKEVPPATAIDQKPELFFFPESGVLWSRVENKLVVKLSKADLLAVPIRGRIVSSTNENVGEAETDQLGILSFKVRLSRESHYQLILEKGKRFYFYDLPELCDKCNRLTVEQDPFSWKISIRRKDSANDRCELRIYDAQNLVFNKQIFFNQLVEIPKDQLPNGELLVRAVYEGDVGNQRMIWNGPVKKVSKDFLGQYERRQQIEKKFHFPENANLSIAVKKVQHMDRQTLTSILALAKPHNYHFAEEMDESALDDWMIASQWKHDTAYSRMVPFLPEVRGDLVEGRITDQQGLPVPDIRIGLTIPGNPYQVKIALSDNGGKFLFNGSHHLNFSGGQLQIFDEQKGTTDPRIHTITYTGRNPINGNLFYEMDSTFSIEIFNEFYSDYPDFPERPLTFDSAYIAKIIRRSINNQIEKAFYTESNLRDTTEAIPQFDDFRSYYLDDYTRFSTIRETFIEYISEVGVSRNEDKYHFNMRILDNSSQVKGLDPILLVDGTFATPEQVFQMSPYLVQRIDVCSKKYAFRGEVFQGIIALHTSGEDQLKTIPASKRTAISLRSPDDEERIPDYRELLLWNPLSIAEGGQATVSFQTSDVPGFYAIDIEGITSDGEPVKALAYFEVE